MTDWQPLQDIWDDYSEKLDEIESAEIADEEMWPYQLFMGMNEKEDVKQFVTDRISEMVSYAQNTGGINLQWIGGFVFKSLVAGMLWERERVGK